MSRNGSGTYSLPSGNPVVTGTTISSTTHNTTMSDIANALTTSLASDGQTTPTANLPMGGYKHTGVANGSSRTDYASLGQIQDSTAQLVTVTGTDTIVATSSPAVTAYATGQTFRFVSAGANTGAATFNLNSLGAKSITKLGTTALVAGDIPASSVVTVTYDGTQFQLISATDGSKIQLQSYTRFTAGGTADAITGTLSPAIASYTGGLRVTTTPGGANTVTGPTMNLNSLGTKTIKKRDSGGSKVALSAGDYNASGPFNFEYDGVDFVLLDPITSSSAATGFRNKIINGGCQIAQRGALAAITGSAQYGQTDRFCILASGTGLSGTFSQNSGWGASTTTGCSTSANVSVTTGTIYQQHRIEAAMIPDLAGKNATFSCKIYHDFGSTTNFTFNVTKATVKDDFTSVATLATSASTTADVPSGVMTQVSFTFPLTAADVANGIMVQVFNTNPVTISSKSICIADWQLEAGSVATPFETRPYGTELALCQRYLPAYNSDGTTSALPGIGYNTTTTNARIAFPFPVPPRTKPSGITVSNGAHFTTQSNGGSNFVASAAAISLVSQNACWVDFTISGATANQPAQVYFNNATGKLLFTGCEL